MLPPDNLLLAVARSADRIDSTAPSINEIDAATTLDVLARAIVEHNRRLFSGEPVDWAALAALLGDTEQVCRRLRPSHPSNYCAQPAADAARSHAAMTRLRPLMP